MRILASFLFVNALVFAQNMTEVGAAVAGSAIGGASGKPVSEGISTIFGKVGQPSTSAPAKETKVEKDTRTERETKAEKQSSAESAKASPGGASGESAGGSAGDPAGVPPPPPPVRKRTAAVIPVAQFVVPAEVAQIGSWADVAPMLPPPAVMSPENFHSVSPGMTREDVLSLGAPDSKITMFEDGHLVELYSYHQNGQKFGGLRLIDGVVASIQ
jgi:hypothetical protein